MASTDDLWGGQLTAIQFDPVGHTCELHITVLRDGRSTAYLISARGVSDFRFRNAIPGPWEYAEVTEAHGDIDTSGQSVLQLLLWSEDAELVLRCCGIEVVRVP